MLLPMGIDRLYCMAKDILFHPFIIFYGMSICRKCTKTYILFEDRIPVRKEVQKKKDEDLYSAIPYCICLLR
jgi:hypothetical protein